jgi:hypothetical protein
MRHGADHHRGFVLLWTLALLALAAVVLTGLTRRSARRAVEAVDAQEQLQRKWAMASCRKLAKDNAEALLKLTEKRRHAAVASMSLQGVLGNIQLQARIADEQAKVNVNTIYEEMGKDRTATLVRDVARGAGLARVLLRPDPRYAKSRRSSARTDVAAKSASTIKSASTMPTTAPAEWPAFGCWAQVFDSDDPAVLLADSVKSPTNELTCWGDGRLNIDRASTAAIRAVLGQHLSIGVVQTLLDERSKNLQKSPDEWLAGMKLSAEQNQALTQLVTEQSACHSVMIHVRAGGRDWYELEVFETKPVSSQKDQATTAPSPGMAPSAGITPSAGMAPAMASAGSNEIGQERVYRLVW